MSELALLATAACTMVPEEAYLTRWIWGCCRWRSESSRILFDLTFDIRLRLSLTDFALPELRTAAYAVLLLVERALAVSPL
jgi:hypothetical protein